MHYLVLACADGLDTPYDLGREHLPLLEQMVKLGRRWAGRASETDPNLRFRFGFHTVSIHTHRASVTDPNVRFRFGFHTSSVRHLVAP